MTLLALFFLAAWFLVSVLCHLDPVGGHRLRSFLHWLGQRDCLQLLTTWNLFAPVPVDGDCRLLIRDRLSSGKQTRWREVSLIRNRRPLHFLWNPDLLPATQFADAVDWADVYLLSRLPGDVVEDLFCVPIESDAEIVRLLALGDSRILLGGGQHAYGEVRG